MRPYNIAVYLRAKHSNILKRESYLWILCFKTRSSTFSRVLWLEGRGGFPSPEVSPEVVLETEVAVMSHRESGLLGGPDQVMNEVTATNTISLGEFSLQIVDALGVVLRYAI